MEMTVSHLMALLADQQPDALVLVCDEGMYLEPQALRASLIYPLGGIKWDRVQEGSPASELPDTRPGVILT